MDVAVLLSFRYMLGGYYHSIAPALNKAAKGLWVVGVALFRRACANVPDPRRFMQEHGAVFGWDGEIVAKARVFTPRPLPSPVRYFSKPWHCYDNCLAKAESIYYCEGLVIGPGGPTIHAWNSTDGWNVIDLGWPCQHLNKYLGFVLDLKEHAEIIGTFGWFYHFAQQNR